MGAFEHFSRRNGPDAGREIRRDHNILAWRACSAFFGEVAAALKALGSGKVTLEMVCGGLPEELGKMRNNRDSCRPKEFPRSYMRMWLSNVP